MTARDPLGTPGGSPRADGPELSQPTGAEIGSEGRSGAPVVSAPFRPIEPSGGGPSPALIGCAALLVLLAVAAIFALSKSQDLFRAVMQRVEVQVLENAGPEVSEGARAEFREAMAGLIEAVEEKRVDAARLREVQTRLVEISKKGEGEVTEEDLRELSAALRSATTGPLPQLPGPEPVPTG